MKKWQDKFWKPRVVSTRILNALPPGERGIKKVYFVEELDGTPARCLRSTGECWISLKHWRKLPFEHKVFILLHENAHIALDTSDELAVDAYAHAQYMKMGYSLTESVKALTRVLSYSGEEHFARTREQAIRATVYDIHVNGNKKLLNKLKQMDTKRKTNRK